MIYGAEVFYALLIDNLSNKFNDFIYILVLF